MSHATILATRLRARVAELGLDRDALALRLGVDATTAARLVGNETDPPAMGRSMTYLAALGCDVTVTVRRRRAPGQGRLLVSLDGGSGRGA